MSQDDYKALVSKAEQAVASVSDPALKQIAFQKVLDDLLRSSHQGEEVSAPAKPKHRKSAAPARTSGKAKSGPTAYIQEMIGENFFKQPKTISQVQEELANRAHTISDNVVSMTLMRFCKSKKLRRAKGKGSDGNNTYSYSNW